MVGWREKDGQPRRRLISSLLDAVEEEVEIEVVVRMDGVWGGILFDIGR